MKKVLLLLTAVAVFVFAIACSKPAPAPNTAASTPKPATASASPKGTPKKAPATNPVPGDWIRMFDDVKGYEFMVPKGTEHTSQNADGVDVYMASVPAPYDIGVMVVAFKDKSLSKEDLLQRAENILKAFEEKDIKIEPAKELNDDYSIATFTSTGKDGKPGKGKILVATDVTDNYIMLVGGDADKFGSNEKTIDEIWGSFGMYSGGYSGNS